MELIHVAAFCGVALLYTVLLPATWRGWALMLVSVVAIYWLQPTLQLRWLDYTLPTLTLGVLVLAWRSVQKAAEGRQSLTRDDGLALAVLVGAALLFTLSRYIDLELTITSRPPPIEYALSGIAIFGVVGVGLGRLRGERLLLGGVMLLIVLFILVKTEPLTAWLSGVWRSGVGQDAALASALDIRWLGFSYVAFRIIHTLRDSQSGRLPALSLREYVTYVIFFPSLTAGPIDRAERFLKDYQALPTIARYDADRIAQGSTRIAVGLFKKFVIADSLAVFSLSAMTVTQADTTGALWVMVYAYAFQLFFDFSGYTDIAIGIGILFGVKLPENFNRPYLKTDIASFWQSWHKTLSDWVRFYVYTPLSRTLIKRKWRKNQVIFAVTMTTMIVIGLWHGVTVPFFIWGAWHGIGLFLHRLWSDRTRTWYRQLAGRRAQVWQGFALLLTFHFVVVGWVWFALPQVDTAAETVLRLFGVGW